ncbi:MAG: hypothetical protein Q4G14_08130 [Paracoccus sp. (in: a-proteobacteria)]|uniref:hypothetical protein n=1 Tax=Paracoccus sp. TaxID=267 RepID=UPI0026DEAE07|nr:hypothetical protein [Paracoccus sp. (in: a-proteobacteria)]MDO5613193.1 hypothetical protein [Paracoccus sp. (in: a-proteobacteria)]
MQRTDCQRKCLIAAAGIGLAVWLVSAGIGDLHWFAGLFLGLVAGGLSYALAVWLGCDDQPEYDPGISAVPPAAAPVALAAVRPVVAAPEPAAPAPQEPLAETVADVVPQETAPEPTALPVAEEPAPVAAVVAPDPVLPAVSVADDFDARLTKAKKPKKDKDDKKKSKAKKARKDKAAKDEKPAKAKKAKKAKPVPAEDLKQIKGVGPKLENLLNDHGVTRFEQIAGWDDAQIDRFAALIGRMGARVRADDWVGQARLLAAGEQTEFSQRVEAGEVYE